MLITSTERDVKPIQLRLPGVASARCNWWSIHNSGRYEMPTRGKSVTIPARDFYGSRMRCLLLTHQPTAVVARRLTELVEPFALVDPDQDHWAPVGFSDPEEIELGKAGNFLTDEQRQILTDWWLAVPRGARTPTWDIVSSCTVDGVPGLMLVEAKAHIAEMDFGGKRVPDSPNGLKNHSKVEAAVANSSQDLNAILPGFSLSIDSHYQLCNRFAWSWKLASMGVPVVLVYLGFLNADDMAYGGREIFESASAWESAVHNYADGIVPGPAWERPLDVAGTPVIPLIRSMDMRWLS